MGTVNWLFALVAIILIAVTIFVYIKYWKYHRFGGKFKNNFPDEKQISRGVGYRHLYFFIYLLLKNNELT